MNSYFLLKTVHIVSSTVLFGTGLGTAFFKWIVDRTNNVTAIRVVSEKVVLADWLFTTPAIFVQAITGLHLIHLMGYSIAQRWVVTAIALYAFAGACWIPVVVLQIRMRTLARLAERDNAALPPQYWRYARRWFWLGVPAFAAVIVIFWLMVTKPG
jgi:uncharacterized membrane protein